MHMLMIFLESVYFRYLCMYVCVSWYEYVFCACILDSVFLICVDICIVVCIHMCFNVCFCVCVPLCVHVHVCVFVCVSAFMISCIYIYIYICYNVSMCVSVNVFSVCILLFTISLHSIHRFISIYAHSCIFFFSIYV